MGIVEVLGKERVMWIIAIGKGFVKKVDFELFMMIGVENRIIKRGYVDYRGFLG